MRERRTILTSNAYPRVILVIQSLMWAYCGKGNDECPDLIPVVNSVVRLMIG